MAFNNDSNRVYSKSKRSTFHKSFKRLETRFVFIIWEPDDYKDSHCPIGMFFADEELKVKIKSLIQNEMEIIKANLGIDDLKNNDQIIIRLIEVDLQDYIKQRYEDLNYDIIFEKFINGYISKEQVVMDIIIQIIDE